MTRQDTPARYRITGMDCASCAMKIETAVRRLPGVEDVGVSVAASTMRVNGPADQDVVEAAVRGLGYGIVAERAGTQATPAQGHAHDHDNDAGGHVHSHADLGDGPWWRSRKAQLTIACALALVAAYVTGMILPGLGHWPFVAALAVGLVPVARRAMTAALAGTPFSIETLMTIAAIGAVIIGATEEAAMVVLLFLVGELLEGVAAQRARASIGGLTALIPATALVGEPGALREVAADTLKPGDVITVRPGDRLAADGVIVEGASALDEAPVTGESVPVAKAPGASVFAGTINTEAVLRVQVTATAENNTIARVVRLVEEAQESKAPTERFIDRFARYYTPGVLVLGALVAVAPPLVAGADWGTWVYKGLAVLLIGCPCALVISTPAAIAAGLSAGARRGLLIKGGAVLEKLREVDMVAFDKTGTLTAGRPVVTDIVPLARNGAEVLALAAAVESGSSHPLARAILNRAAAEAVAVPAATGAAAIPGKGVRAVVGAETVTLASPTEAEAMVGPDAVREARIAALSAAGKTVSVLIAGDEVAGLIAFRDELRADAILALARLKADGVGAVMLTGDNPRTAGAIAGELGIEVHAGMLPGDKQAIVRRMQAEGKVVAKVGDGINDAPALAAADVGIAMGGGTDVALETADAAALHARMADIPAMIALSRATMANIGQNITIALGLKGVFLVTTLLGITGLWPAILADTGATVLVTANALRLLGWRPGA